MGRCPCASLRVGASVLAFCTYIAVQSRVLFGVSAEEIARHAFNGNMTAMALMSGWGLIALLGLMGVVEGYRSARTHTDLVRFGSLLWSGGVIAFCCYLLQLPPPAQPNDISLHEFGHALVVGWLTGNVVNIWLQLRGSFNRRPYVPVPVRAPQPPAASSSIFWMRRRRVEEEFYVERRRSGAAPAARSLDLPSLPLADFDDGVPVLDHDAPGGAISYEPVRHAVPLLPSRQRVR